MHEEILNSHHIHTRNRKLRKDYILEQILDLMDVHVPPC